MKILNLQKAQIYQGEHIVLRNVDLRMNKGEFAYLIGKTGSGKSSLLKTLYGALPLQSGKGEVAGYDLKKLNRSTIPLLRRELGIVFQDFNLLSDRSVEDNLYFVLKATGWRDKDAMYNQVQKTLRKVDLASKAKKMPHEISGGEKQRIVIARALLNDPKLIIADEPTGNLDPETSDEILLLLRQLAQHQNSAVLFATHDYRILEQFPARIIRCMNGQVMDEEGIAL